jgi:hypothetical protein
MSAMLFANAGDLVPYAVLAGEDALDDLDHRLMLLGRLRDASSFAVRCGDIDKQIARVAFADDVEISQRQKERLADSKCGHALGVIEPCAVCHLF